VKKPSEEKKIGILMNISRSFLTYIFICG